MDKSKFKLIPLHGDIIPDVVNGLKAMEEIDQDMYNLHIEKQEIYESVYEEIEKVHGNVIRNRPVAVDPTGHFILVLLGEDDD